MGGRENAGKGTVRAGIPLTKMAAGLAGVAPPPTRRDAAYVAARRLSEEGGERGGKCACAPPQQRGGREGENVGEAPRQPERGSAGEASGATLPEQPAGDGGWGRRSEALASGEGEANEEDDLWVERDCCLGAVPVLVDGRRNAGRSDGKRLLSFCRE